MIVKKAESPFPNHEGYSKVRATLSPGEQIYMKKNIKVTDD
jgi:dihydroorotase-like cyclic amidohydrolase